MLIYFAGPLFNEGERAYNLTLTSKLEAAGFEVFLPQRDGVELDVTRARRETWQEKRQAIFELDRDKLLEADIFLFLLDGRVPDEGACVELGIAYGQKYSLEKEKLLIGLMTDTRAAFPDEKLNAMIDGALDMVKGDEASLLAAVQAYRKGRA